MLGYILSVMQDHKKGDWKGHEQVQAKLQLKLQLSPTHSQVSRAMVLLSLENHQGWRVHSLFGLSSSPRPQLMVIALGTSSNIAAKSLALPPLSSCRLL